MAHLHFFSARLVHYVSPAGPQYGKERLITILHCKSTTKKRKAQRFDPLRPN